METYEFLRHLADSWFLLMMTLIFLGIIVWAFRPGSRALHQDVAASIFRNEDRPVPEKRAASLPTQAKMKEG